MAIEDILFNKMGLSKDTLEGKCAVVTGGAMGIGKQVALGLAVLGCELAIIDKERESLRLTAEEISATGAPCTPLVADICQEGQLEGAIDAQLNMWGRVDIFISNAVESFIGSYQEESVEVWDKVFNTNIKFPTLAIKKIIPGMVANGYGVVANVIAMEGLTFASAYSASKTAMRSFTTSLATEIGSDAGVSIFSFSPGIVDTPLVNNYFYPELARRFDVTMQDIIEGIGGNPGYDGLMPAEDCGAALIDYIVHAENYNGQAVSPFLSLAKAGVINFEDLRDFDGKPSEEKQHGAEVVNTTLREYLKSITKINQNLEHRVEVHTKELKNANAKLQQALDEVKQLSGMLPICAHCKNIRDDKGYWNQIETYIAQHTDADFSHSICPECTNKLYHDEPWFKGKKKS